MSSSLSKTPEPGVSQCGTLPSNIISVETKTSTIIIDQCPLFREGLKQVLADSTFAVIASETDLSDVDVAEVVPSKPLLIILASSPEFAEDLAALKTARMRFPGSEIVCLRRGCTRQQAGLLMRLGAAAILPTPNRPESLVEVLELVMLGQHVVPLYLMGCLTGLGEEEVSTILDEQRKRAETRGQHSNLSRLSTREVEIVRCLLAGEPNRSIAQKLLISEATVKVHVKAILRKIKVKNRTQAAIWALNNMRAAEAIAAAPLVSRAVDYMNALQAVVPV